MHVSTTKRFVPRPSLARFKSKTPAAVDQRAVLSAFVVRVEESVVCVKTPLCELKMPLGGLKRRLFCSQLLNVRA
jgi:hypothetical protein